MLVDGRCWASWLFWIKGAGGGDPRFVTIGPGFLLHHGGWALSSIRNEHGAESGIYPGVTLGRADVTVPASTRVCGAGG